MQYSNTTDKNGLLQRCEYYTLLGDGVITGNTLLKAQFTQSINNHYHRVVNMILESQDEWDFDDINHTDYPILTTPLVAGQRDYSIPASEKVLKLKRVDVTYDGVNYYKAEPIDASELSVGLGNDTNVDAYFSKSAPRYDVQYGSVFIYPLANATDVANGAKARFQWTREIDEFTTSDTTQEPGIDEAFHEMLPLGASLDWLSVNKPQNTATIQVIISRLQEYEDRLKKHYSRKQQDREYKLIPRYVNYK